MKLNRVFTILALILLSVFNGLKGAEPAKPAGPAVTVSRPIEHEVLEWDEYSARFQSPQVTNVSARVSRIMLKTEFTEGSLVKEGDILFNIDHRPYSD